MSSNPTETDFHQPPATSHQPPLLRAWKIGRLFGIRVYVHWTCILLLVPALLGSRQGSLAQALLAAILVPAILACVLLHEFGHCLAARLHGLRTRDITLFPIGGVARLEGLGKRPLQEFFIALAGPAVNIGISFLLVLCLLPLDPPLVLDPLPSDTPAHLAGTLVFTLLLANLVLAFFNLLPAFPMDGGRVVRALLQLRLGRLRATEIAAHAGLVMAALIAVLLPVILYRTLHEVVLMPVLVGAVVAYAGQRELGAVRQAEAEREELPVCSAEGGGD